MDGSNRNGLKEVIPLGLSVFHARNIDYVTSVTTTKIPDIKSTL